MNKAINIYGIWLIVGSAIIDLISFNNMALNKDHHKVINGIK